MLKLIFFKKMDFNGQYTNKNKFSFFFFF